MEVTEAAEAVCNELLPAKSGHLYIKEYDKFTNWRNNVNCVGEITENSLLAYFMHITSIRKASSFWSIYSMLRSTILVKHRVNIANFSQFQNENHLDMNLKKQDKNLKQKIILRSFLGMHLILYT